MDGGARPPSRRFRVSPVDRLGRSISPLVLNAAEEIGRRAMEHAEKSLIDSAVAAGLLEEAAATVSRAIDSKRRFPQNEVRDLPSYLFYAFLRRLNRASRRQSSQEHAVRLLASASDSLTNPQVNLERKILVDEFLTRCDPVTRDMFYRRIEGFSWKEIAVPYGISAHAARSRFSQTLSRIAVRLGLKSDS